MCRMTKRYWFQTRMSLNWFMLLISLWCFGIAGSFVIAAEIPKGEERLRAAIVVGILRYTTWVDEVANDPELLICSVGQTASAKGLKTAGNQVTVHDRRLRVMTLRGDEDLGSCSVVIYGETSSTPLTNEVSTNYVNQLSICDGCNTDRYPSIVKLTRQSGRIGLEVNLTEAKKSGLKFSSDMLELATIVGGDSND